jgi:hypothetical protein
LNFQEKDVRIKWGRNNLRHGGRGRGRKEGGGKKESNISSEEADKGRKGTRR